MKRWILFLLVFFSFVHCIEGAEVNEVKRKIETKVLADSPTIVRYQEEFFYSNEDFSKISENQDNFKKQLREKFEKRISEYNEKATNVEFVLNNDNKSVTLKCDISGAISSKGENKYYATFGWLISPLGLDFINNNFTKTEKGLFWSGKINELDSEINCYFPQTGEIYKAWAHPTGHCHAHVWWKLQ